MLYIAENINNLRRGRALTQEEAAEMLGVSAQSVSKWERGETLPDITLLPAIANMYGVSVDALIGMDRINDKKTRASVFTAGHGHLRNGDYDAAIGVYSEALKTFPNDEGVMSDLAMALALDGSPERLAKAVSLCERVLSEGRGEKIRHTTRAAVCFVYYKAGEKDRALAAAKELPHLRESREAVLGQLEKVPSVAEIDSYLKFIAVGEYDEQDCIEIDFGPDMIAVCSEHSLLEKIEALRDELGAPNTDGNYRVLPRIRIRDKTGLAPNRLRLRHYADYLIDTEYTDCGEAARDIINALKKIARANAEQMAMN